MVQLRESNVRPVKRSTEWAYSAAVEYKNSEIMKEMFYIDTFQYSFSGLYFLSKIWMWRQAILNDVTGLWHTKESKCNVFRVWFCLSNRGVHEWFLLACEG